MRPDAMMTFQIKTLDRVKFHATGAISKEFALRPEAQFYVDEMTQNLVLSLRASVLEDRTYHDEKVLRFAEQPVYRTWRQHLVASLPVGSFRRRILERFWEIDEPNGTKIVHEVTLIKRALFPGSRMEYPDHLGQVQYVVSSEDRYWTEDA